MCSSRDFLRLPNERRIFAIFLRSTGIITQSRFETCFAIFTFGHMVSIHVNECNALIHTHTHVTMMIEFESRLGAPWCWKIRT